MYFTMLESLIVVIFLFIFIRSPTIIRSPTSSPMSVGGYLRTTQPYGKPFGPAVARGGAYPYEQQVSLMAHQRLGV